jgi:CBS domain-containing protein
MATVNELLSKKGEKTFSIDAGTIVYEALNVMAINDIDALLVVENEELLGIFSTRDYARKYALGGKNEHDIFVRDVMFTRLISVTPKNRVEDCLKLMTEQHIRHLPVYENEILIGLITIDDVVEDVIEDKRSEINHLEKYITGGYLS